MQQALNLINGLASRIIGKATAKTPAIANIGPEAMDKVHSAFSNYASIAPDCTAASLLNSEGMLAVYTSRKTESNPRGYTVVLYNHGGRVYQTSEHAVTTGNTGNTARATLASMDDLLATL